MTVLPSAYRAICERWSAHRAAPSARKTYAMFRLKGRRIGGSGMDESAWVTMTRDLVHRDAADGVFIDAYRQPSARGVEFRLRQPSELNGFAESARTTDSLLIAEYLRQATIAYGHLAWNVPMGWAFIMGRMEITVEQAEATGELTAHVTPLLPKLSTGSLRTVTTDVTFRADGMVYASGRGELTVVTAAMYKRLRGDIAGQSSPRKSYDSPDAVRLVQVDDSRTEWDVHFDPADAFFFDHAVDHMPGILLFAAVRQACIRAAGRLGTDIRQFDGRYVSYADLDEPLRVRVSAAKSSSTPGGFAAVVYGRDDRTILNARVEVAT